MASKGIEAIVAWAKDGTKPANTPGKDFFDTGVALVTDNPVAGVDSIDTKEGTDLCCKFNLGSKSTAGFFRRTSLNKL